MISYSDNERLYILTSSIDPLNGFMPTGFASAPMIKLVVVAIRSAAVVPVVAFPSIYIATLLSSFVKATWCQSEFSLHDVWRRLAPESLLNRTTLFPDPSPIKSTS